MCLPKQPKSLQFKGRGLAGRDGGVKPAAAAAAKPVDKDTVKATNNNVEKEAGGYDDPRSFIMDVSSEDVVLGRGAGPNEMAGNISFRQIVAQFKPSYIATVNRKAKSQIAHKVVQTVKSKRGRFLRRAKIQGSSTSSSSSSSSLFGAGAGADQDIFVEAEEEVVLEKAKQALRYGKRDNGRRSDQLASSPPSSSSSSSPSPTHHHHLPLHGVVSPSAQVAHPAIRHGHGHGRVGQGHVVPVALKSVSLGANTAPGVASSDSSFATAPIGGVVPTRNTPTIAFLMQRQNRSRDSQTRREVQPNAERHTSPVPLPVPTSTMTMSSLSSNSFRQRPAINSCPRRPTESDVIDEALAASVRESSSDEEMVQLLIDKAIAVRHQFPRASTQLLDLVESLIGTHNTAPSLSALCQNQNNRSLPSETQRGRIVSPSSSRDNVAERFYTSSAVPTKTASDGNKTHHDAAKTLATLSFFLKA